MSRASAARWATHKLPFTDITTITASDSAMPNGLRVQLPAARTPPRCRRRCRRSTTR